MTTAHGPGSCSDKGALAVPRAGRRNLSVTVLGYLGSDLGVGQSGRLWLDALRQVTDPVAIDLGDPWAPGHRSRHLASSTPQDHRPRHGMSDVRLLCVNADETRLMAHHPAVLSQQARWTVGVWHWEAGGLPAWMLKAFDVVDEVWAGSTFTARILAAQTSKRVRSMPLPVPHGPDLGSCVRRSDLGLPENFLFFFEFDYRSVFDRKNPLALIESFCLAFAPGEGPVLLVKTMNAAMFPSERRLLEAAARARPDIILRDVRLSTDDNSKLMLTCDAYVSLHRAEGFGLTIAEAVGAGKPVIATGYSGPMEFLRPDHPLLVPYKLQPIGAGHYPYRAGDVWAEPDISAAAERMRWVFTNAEPAKAFAADLRARCLHEHSLASLSALASSALDDIGQDCLPASRARPLGRLSPLVAQATWPARVQIAKQARRARRRLAR